MDVTLDARPTLAIQILGEKVCQFTPGDLGRFRQVFIFVVIQRKVGAGDGDDAAIFVHPPGAAQCIAVP
jgi:hypothetical protein